MNNRRKLIVVLGTAGSFPFAAVSQQPKKIYRIGYLSTGPRIEPRDEAFRQRLGELGYVDGKNSKIEWRFFQGINERAPAFAAELVRLGADCIVANGASSVQAAKQASDTIPIVILTIDADPVALGFIASLARPGGNITGFTGIAYELAGKRLELLKELAPRTTRVGMLVPAPMGDASQAHYRGTEIAARKLGMEIQLLAPESPEELDRLLGWAPDRRPEVLSVYAGGWFNSHRPRVIHLAEKMKLPAIYSTDTFVPIGGLISYSVNTVHQFAEAAIYVAKILAGARPADLPVQQPTKFELAINLKTAKALGLTVPQSIMVRADRVIQ